MPHLKVQDVQDQLEVEKKEINERLDAIDKAIEEIVTYLKDSGVNPTTANVDNTASAVKEVKKLRSEVLAHVNVYNKHIMQQHSPQQ